MKQLLRVAKKNIPTIVHNLLINSGDGYNSICTLTLTHSLFSPSLISVVQLDQVLNVVATLTSAKP